MEEETFLEGLSEIKLIEMYGLIIKELKGRGVIRTNNLVGEIGEYIAIDYYNRTAGLPKLEVTQTSTKNFDATSRGGKRYSIKCVTGNTTGAFYGVPKPNEIPDEDIPQNFDYLIIVKLNKDYSLQKFIELDWMTFLKNRKWHSRMNVCNITINKKLETASKIIIPN